METFSILLGVGSLINSIALNRFLTCYKVDKIRLPQCLGAKGIKTENWINFRHKFASQLNPVVCDNSAAFMWMRVEYFNHK